MIVSQSCDISWRRHILVAPVGQCERDFNGETLDHVVKNEVGYLFALPSAPPDFPSSYADLSRITAVHNSYFRADALVKRLSSKGMIELQACLTDFFGRPIGFNVNDDVPQDGVYGCISCFTAGRLQPHQQISTGGKFPECGACGSKALWIKIPIVN